MTDPFQELLDALANQTISDEQFAQLERSIGEDAALRKRFLDFQSLIGNLEEDAIQDETLQPEPLRPAAHQSDVALSWRRRLGRIEHAALAALLLLCLGLTFLLWQNANPGNEGITGASQGSGPKTETIATLTMVSDDVVWNEAHGAWRTEGQGLDKGWMQLDAGVIEITFRSGATVRVEGPALFGIDSPLRGFLEHGAITVHAPDEARDFVVGTSAMEVVDLGTRFEMSVDQDTSAVAVEVTEGLVDLHIGDEQMRHRIQPLPAGQSALVDATGKVVKITGKAIDPAYRSASSLLAHWPLDDMPANGQVTDASGNGLHGRLKPNTNANSLGGKVGQALDLSPRGYIDLSDHIASLTNTSTFTFTAWVRDARDMVFSMSDGTKYDRVQFELHGNQLLYGWQKGARFDHIAGRISQWQRGRWYHIAVSVSGGAVTIYRDGQALNSPRGRGLKINTRTRVPADIDRPTHAYIGHLIANHNNSGQFLAGKIDDIQFYSRALDGRSIRFLFEHPGQTFQEPSVKAKQPHVDDSLKKIQGVSDGNQ
jgi:hypothetical protein